MKPLRDSTGDPDPALARAATLVAELRPTEMTPDARQRVRAALRVRRSRRGGAWRMALTLGALGFGIAGSGVASVGTAARKKLS